MKPERFAEITEKVHSWMGRNFLLWLAEIQSEEVDSGRSIQDEIEEYFTSWGYLLVKVQPLVPERSGIPQLVQEIGVEPGELREWLLSKSVIISEEREWFEFTQALKQLEQAAIASGWTPQQGTTHS